MLCGVIYCDLWFFLVFLYFVVFLWFQISEIFQLLSFMFLNFFTVCYGFSKVLAHQITPEYSSREFYDTWFNDHIKTREPFHQHPTQNKCKNLLTHGKWTNFTLSGFSRYVNSSKTKSMIKITHPYHFDYPYKPWPFFKPWNRQNYTGTWMSAENCEIKKLSQTEITQCFDSGRKRVVFIGDSRTRQLANALSKRFNNESSFQDTQFYHFKNYYRKRHIGRIDYIWSQHFGENLPGFVNGVKTIGNFSGLLVIGEHILHPLERYIKKNPEYESESAELLVHIHKNPGVWIKRLVIDKLKIILDELKFLIQDILLVGSSHRYVDKLFNPVYVKLINEYNFQLKSLVDSYRNDGFYRIEFLSVIAEIGVSPTLGIPLAIDGTHLNWMDVETVLVPAQISLTDVILNYYCRDKSVRKLVPGSSIFCCF